MHIFSKQVHNSRLDMSILKAVPWQHCFFFFFFLAQSIFSKLANFSHTANPRTPHHCDKWLSNSPLWSLSFSITHLPPYTLYVAGGIPRSLGQNRDHTKGNEHKRSALSTKYPALRGWSHPNSCCRLWGLTCRSYPWDMRCAVVEGSGLIPTTWGYLKCAKIYGNFHYLPPSEKRPPQSRSLSCWALGPAAQLFSHGAIKVPFWPLHVQVFTQEKAKARWHDYRRNLCYHLAAIMFSSF